MGKRPIWACDAAIFLADELRAARREVRRYARVPAPRAAVTAGAILRLRGEPSPHGARYRVIRVGFGLRAYWEAPCCGRACLAMYRVSAAADYQCRVCANLRYPSHSGYRRIEFLRWQLERYRGRRGRHPRSRERLRRELLAALDDAARAANAAVMRRDGRVAGPLLSILRQTRLVA